MLGKVLDDLGVYGPGVEEIRKGVKDIQRSEKAGQL
jgi:hypothetical protein